MVTRHTGHLPDPTGAHPGQPLERLVGSATIADSVYLGSMAPPHLDQRGSSCVAAALAMGIELSAELGGWGLDPSYLAIYAGARELEAPGLDVLPDLGSYPHRAIQWLEEWGIVAHARWPDRSPLESPVPLDVLEAGAPALVTGVYGIQDSGEALSAGIRAALSAGYPVVYASEIDQAYNDGPGPVWTGVTGKAHGSHARLIVGFDDVGPLEWGSWGPRWNGDGCVRTSWSWVERECRDVYVLTVAPREVR